MIMVTVVPVPRDMPVCRIQTVPSLSVCVPVSVVQASPDRLPVEGNQLVNRMVGTSTVLAPNAAYLTHLKPRVEKLAADIL